MRWSSPWLGCKRTRLEAFKPSAGGRVGIAMLIVGALFVAWALLRPPSAEVEQAEAEQAG
jgi:hypothetical protein